MSYIRTKDGRIIDTTKYPEHPASWSVQASDYALTIKESETIEELCDEFLYVNKPNEDYEKFEKPLIAIQNKFETMVKIAKITNSDLYGAIYTDKGLIYVAKMDNEGKLVLI